MPTTGSILARLQFQEVNQIAPGINLPINVDVPSGGAPTELASGTGAGQITKGWVDKRTLVAASVTLDVNALAAAATNTGAAAFTSITGILIINDPSSTGNLTIGNADTVPFPFNGVGLTTTSVLKPGGSYLYSDPSAAGLASTVNKLLKLDAGASTCTFTIVLVGRV